MTATAKKIAFRSAYQNKLFQANSKLITQTSSFRRFKPNKLWLRRDTSFNAKPIKMLSFSSVAEAYRPDPPSPAGVNFLQTDKSLSHPRRIWIFGSPMGFLPDREASLSKKEYRRCGPHPLQVISSRARPYLLRERAALAIHLKIYPQVKFLGITFDSKLTFQKRFEEILGRCNTRYHRVRLIVNKKWGPSPSTILQIYKQCVRPIFEYGSLSTITMSDMIISKIERLQNKLIRLALRLPNWH